MMLSPEQYVHNQVATYPVLYHADSYESAARKVFDQFFNVIGNGVYLPEELDLPIVDQAEAEKFLRLRWEKELSRIDRFISKTLSYLRELHDETTA